VWAWTLLPSTAGQTLSPRLSPPKGAVRKKSHVGSRRKTHTYRHMSLLLYLNVSILLHDFNLLCMNSCALDASACVNSFLLQRLSTVEFMSTSASPAWRYIIEREGTDSTRPRQRVTAHWSSKGASRGRLALSGVVGPALQPTCLSSHELTLSDLAASRLGESSPSFASRGLRS